MCIVGSGAGGGVIAGELAAAGRSVVVLEAGDYLDDADFDGLELNAYQRSYLGGGPFPTVEGAVSIVAGSGVGGGTVINWTNCLRTYDHVRAEWASEHGLSDLAESDFDRHLDAVFERLGVNDECSDLNGPHQRMREGCERLGYDFRLITRNADRDLYAPESAAFMGFGDASGSKRSTAKTYLVDAQAAGAEIFVGAAAGRILVEDGRAAGVEARWSDPAAPQPNGAGAATLTVRAPVVVVAAGAIQSPALLLRSRIGGPAVGDYLRLHPTVAVTAYYDEPQNWMWGPPQAALSHQYADTGDGYGFLIECAQATTGLFAGAIPWRSGADHKRRMREWAHAAPFVGVTRERGHGRVVIDAAGNPLVHYPISDERDQQHAEAGGGAARPGPRGGRGARDRRQRPAGARLDPRRRPRDVRRRAQRPRDRPPRVRHLLRPSDGQLSHGPRPADLGRQPVGRAPRHPRGLGRRRERLPQRVRHQPDGDDHGARPADRARNPLGMTSLSTVAVTGPTGDVGRAAVRALEQRPEVGKIIGMARRPFDPAEHGWQRTEYRRGDILDRDSVAALVAEADVVVHLAFIIFGDHDEAHRVNLEGSRNVFEATAAPAASRLVYTSSVAAYGFDERDRGWLTEEMPAAGTKGFYYSAHKAELELPAARLALRLGDRRVRLPALDRRRRRRPDPGRDAHDGQPAQRRARAAAQGARAPAAGAARAPRHRGPVPARPPRRRRRGDRRGGCGEGEPGVYNLAAPDEITTADLARELGWATVPVPKAAVAAVAAAIDRAPLTPAIRGVDQRLPHAGAHGQLEGRARARARRLAPGGRDADRDDRGRPRERAALSRGRRGTDRARPRLGRRG